MAGRARCWSHTQTPPTAIVRSTRDSADGAVPTATEPRMLRKLQARWPEDCRRRPSTLQPAWGSVHVSIAFADVTHIEVVRLRRCQLTAGVEYQIHPCKNIAFSIHIAAAVDAE